MKKLIVIAVGLAFVMAAIPGVGIASEMKPITLKVANGVPENSWFGKQHTWWAEQGVIVHTEFRDGNVPAGYEQLRVLKESLENLPEGVEAVRLRSDTAGYQHDLLRYCEEGENERCGRIEFAIGCDVTKAFKEAVSEVEESAWKPIFKEVKGARKKTNREWAEVCFVPNAIAYSKNAPEYRYLATREPLEQLELPGMEKQLEFPFPTMKFNRKRYKIFGTITNM